jgi:peroxiredoxin Q/BCP
MRVGDIVDDFELPDETGSPRRLSELLHSGTVVLFFFPAALSPLCVAEACRFRDVSAEFAAIGAQPVGISGDAPSRQNTFKRTHALGYPLLSDMDGTVREKFHVHRTDYGPAFVRNRRSTFIIEGDRRVLDVIKAEIRVSVHADMALEFLRQRRSAHDMR